MDGSIFISYSHLDQVWMQAFKKHLHGMLMGRCQVWTDEDISPGTTWEQTLLGNLSQAAAAVVLASPDYLVSPWCRRELKSLADARRSRQLGAVYWVLLKPCGWQWTELAELQAVQEPASHALTDEPEGANRETCLLKSCERIAAGVVKSIHSEEPAVAAVRNLLRNSEQAAQTVPTALLAKGDFSIVCRGRHNGDEVVIKVLTNTPLHCMQDLFFDVNRACKSIRNPAVLRIRDVFTIGTDYEKRIVILSELADGKSLADVMKEDTGKPRAERHLTADRVRIVLLRIAEALQALHALEPIEWQGGEPYRHLMGPLVPSDIYYDKLTQRPLVPLAGVANFLWQFFEPETFSRIAGPAHGAYLLPEKLHKASADAGRQDKARLDKQADQYFLGMLALELLELEAQPLFTDVANRPAVVPHTYLDTRSELPRWALRHEQLKKVVARLLAERPENRFPDMATAVAQLHALEESSRALAKYSFRTYVIPNPDDEMSALESRADLKNVKDRDGIAFSIAFYDNFFRRAPTAREVFIGVQEVAGEGMQEFSVPASHHAKLIEAIRSILNFRSGGAPSAIDSVAKAHAGRGAITPKHFEEFEASFLETLLQRIRKVGSEPEEADEIKQAWETLFRPVIEEMKSAWHAHQALARKSAAALL